MTEISPWIPVVATLLGAALGFGGSFAVAMYNRFIERHKEREDRERKRIERSFELLMLIDRECGDLMFSCLKWVNSGEPIKDDQKQGVPPMIELKMIVGLYFGELSEHLLDLKKIVGEFAVYTLDQRLEDYQSKPKVEKQRVSGKVVSLKAVVSQKIEEVQSQFKSRVKA